MTSLPPRIESLEEAERRLVPAVARNDGELDLRELLQKLWRRRRIIMGTMIVLCALALIISSQLTPLFRSTALVMIEPRQSQVVDIASVLSGLPADMETLNSEIAIIKSRHMASKVVRKAELDKDPEFNPALRAPSFLSQSFGWLFGMFASREPDDSPADQRAREFARVVDAFLARLDVSAKSQTRVIEISVASEDPKKAAAILNTVTEHYLVDQLEEKYEATQRAARWLNDRLVELTRKVEISERAVEDYRQEAGLVRGKDDTTVNTSQISELSSQLIVARTQTAEAEARLKQVEALVKTPRGVDTLAEVISSPLVQRLREQESVVLRKLAELSTKYGPKHPQIISVNEDLRDLREKISLEIKTIVGGLRTEVDVSRAREQSLESSLKELEQRGSVLNQKDVQLRALEREATANRTLLETFLTRFKETTAQEGIQTPDARIISAANVPTAPYFPNTVIIVVLTIFGSFVVGVMLVFAVEQLDSGFRSMDQVERLTSVPALGMVPLLDPAKRNGLAPEQYLLEKPISAYAEAIRNLYVSLALSDVDRPPKTVLITSSTPEEGKSAISASLARSVARAGHKVVLIDCDLRRPTAHDRMDLPKKPGLVELLAHKVPLKEVVRKDKASGADVIVAGDHAPNPTDLLNSEQMRLLLAELSKTYDLVVLDCSPVLAVTDARVLARRVDKVVFVVQWERTRRETAMFGLKQILDAGGSVAGILLSKVDVKKHASYGYSDSGYYHGKYQKYYAE